MICPVANATTYVIVTIRRDECIVVRSYVMRLANWAFFGFVRATSFENLYEVTNDRLAGVDRNRRSSLVCASRVSQPVHELPSFLGRILQVLQQLLVSTASTQLVHQDFGPAVEV